MPDVFRTFIVTAADAPVARAIAAAFGPGGKGMWTTGLSPTGAEPSTHYISTGLIPVEFASLISDPGAVRAAVSNGGLLIEEQDIAGILARSDISEDEPFQAMDRLGLKIV